MSYAAAGASASCPQGTYAMPGREDLPTHLRCASECPPGYRGVVAGGAGRCIPKDAWTPTTTPGGGGGDSGGASVARQDTGSTGGVVLLAVAAVVGVGVLAARRGT